jgi:hypothetical protein
MKVRGLCVCCIVHQIEIQILTPVIFTIIVLELCGGELKEISSLEMLKRDDMLFQIVDEDELDELETYEDEDDDEYYT